MKLTLIFLTIFLSVTAAAQNITRIEYFIDTDPGYGNATSVSFTTGTLVTTNFAVNLQAPISDGFHFLSVRAKDANNKWSIISTSPFLKEAIPATSQAGITAIEYFIDNDPGYGLATPVSGTINNASITQNIQIPLSSSLANGFHYLHIRAKDATNKWSVVSTSPFYKEEIPATSQPQITAIEYFIDTDPGYGLATPVSGVTAASGVTKDFIINMGSLPNGLHRLWIRTKDASNKWSFVQIKEFYIQPNVITAENIPNTSCRGLVVKIPYKINDAYNSGNLFTAQLSDINGDFTNPVAIGSIGSTQSDTILALIPAVIPVGNNYQVRIVSSSPSILNGPPKPLAIGYGAIITGQPSVSAVITAGNTATATVTAYGTDLKYQWYSGSTANPQLLAGQTSATLVLSNTQPNQSNTYYCQLSNSCGNLWSTGFQLTIQKDCGNIYPNGVNNPPSLTVVNGTTNVCVGDVVQLSASIINENLSYQWTGTTPIYPTTAGISTVTSGSGVNSYSVTISNATGCTAVATITLQAVKLFSVKSGDWNDPAIWSCQRIPTGSDLVTISSTHVVSLTTTGEAKYLLFNGKITYSLNGQLYVGGIKINNLVVSERRDATTQVVPSSGKEIIVAGVDPSINGFKIQVPGGAYSASKTFKVSYAAIIKHNLGVDFKPLSPLISVENGGDYADSLMKVTIPIQLPSNHFAIVMKYKAGQGFDLLPTIALSSTEITALTNHFSPSTGSAPGGRVAADPEPTIQDKSIVVFAIPMERLNQVTPVTAFKPGIDDWEFTNYGSSAEGKVPAKKGICAGMTVTSMWYYKNRKPIEGIPLYKNPTFQKYAPLGHHLFKDPLWQDNTRGIQFASIVHVEVGFTIDQFKSALNTAIEKKIDNDSRIVNSLKAFFMSQRQPCFLGMNNADLSKGHAVVVYGVNNQGLLIADPNKPGEVSIVPYTTENGLSYSAGVKAGVESDTYYFFTCYEPDFVNPDYLAKKWGEVNSNLPTIGDYFPKFTYRLNKNSSLKIGENYLSVKGRIAVDFSPNIGYDATLLAPPESILATQGSEVPRPNSEFWFKPPIGNNELGLYVYVPDYFEGKPVNYWADFKWFNVDIQQPSLIISSLLITKSGVANKAYSFSISGSDHPESGAFYRWDFGDKLPDNKSIEAGINKDIVTHSYNEKGSFPIKVSITNTDANGTTPEFYYDVEAVVKVGELTVSTQQVQNIIATKAQVQGYIQPYKNGGVASYGICWSSSNPMPTINDSKISDILVEANPPEDKPFSATATGLTKDITYYIRAYAKTSTETIYGNVLTFKHLPDFDPNSIAGEYNLISYQGRSGNVSGTANLSPGGWNIQIWNNSTKTGTPIFSNGGYQNYTGNSTESIVTSNDPKCQCAPCVVNGNYCTRLPAGRIFYGNAGGYTPVPFHSFTDDGQTFISAVGGQTKWVKVR